MKNKCHKLQAFIVVTITIALTFVFNTLKKIKNLFAWFDVCTVSEHTI